MKVLMLSTDARIFERGSAVRERMRSYGRVFDELQIVVARRGARGGREEQIGENVFVHRAPRNPFAWRRIAEPLLGHGGDWVITAQDPFEVGFGAWLLARRFRVPLQLQVHTDFLSPYFAHESLKNRFRVLLAKFLLPRADHIRVVSERIKKSLITQLPNCPVSAEASAGRQLPITVLPIFVDTRKIADAPVVTDLHKKYPGRFIILMASRLTREKNASLALQALRMLATKYEQDTKLRKPLLVIVGDGPEKERLSLLITRYSLQNDVIIEPWANNLASYCKTADCFLITSNYEGYGRTAVEAMAAGLPVVMTDVGLAGEVVTDGENGLVVPVGDATALAQAFERIAGDAALRAQLAQGARGTRQPFRSEEAYLAAYRDALVVRPKLCYVAPAWRADDATHFAYLKEFVQEISKRFDVHLIVERGELPADSGAARVTLCDSPASPRLVEAGRSALLRMLRTELALWRARFSGCRTFYVHYSFFAAYTASWIARFTAGRVLYWNCGEPWRYRRPWLRERFERLTYRLIHTLVTGTSGLADQYAARYGISREKIRVMGNWINISNISAKGGSPPSPGLGRAGASGGKYQISKTQTQKLKETLNISQNHRIVFFAHRLSKRKGAHHLPEIIRAFRDEPVTFLIAGEGPEEQNLKSQISNLKSKHNVRFLGSVPHYQLPKYYAIADAFIMPSEEEGFPHVLLEAMAAGVPYAGTRVGGVEEITPPGLKPYLVDRGDVAEMARALRRLLALSPEERVALQKEMAQWVTRYDLAAALAQFEAIVRV